MEFFDKLGEKATKAYKLTANKTEKVAKDVKIKVRIQTLKGNIDDIYEELGKLVYENYLLDSHEDNSEIKEMIEDKCIKIDGIAKEIQEMNLESMDLKNTKLCSNCNNKIDKESKFCPLCGKAQIISNEEKETTNVENQMEFNEIKDISEENTESLIEEKDKLDTNTQQENLELNKEEEIVVAFDVEEDSNVDEV